jgi:ribosome-binding factor A
VYYTVMGDESQRKATRAGLRSARGHLRAVLGHEVRLKFLPELEFEEDDTVARADRVDELLRGIQEDADGSG